LIVQPAANCQHCWLRVPKQLPVGNMEHHSLDQEVRRIQLATGTRSCDLLQSCLSDQQWVKFLNIWHFCFSVQTCDFTSNYFGEAHE